MGSDEWTRRSIQQDATVEFMVDELNEQSVVMTLNRLQKSVHIDEISSCVFVSL